MAGPKEAAARRHRPFRRWALRYCMRLRRALPLAIQASGILFTLASAAGLALAYGSSPVRPQAEELLSVVFNPAVASVLLVVCSFLAPRIFACRNRLAMAVSGASLFFSLLFGARVVYAGWEPVFTSPISTRFSEVWLNPALLACLLVAGILALLFALTPPRRARRPESN